jgi:hypothetical protein
MLKMDALKVWTALLSAVAVATVTVLAALGTAPAASAVTTDKSADNGASFAVRCDFSHRASDDPIAHFGHPGAAHSHDFFGNHSTKARSTYSSMLANGTTCSRLADKAAYWMPTVTWNGDTINSNRAVFYYRAGGKDHTKVKPFPAGLKVISNSHISWRCGRTDNGGGQNRPPGRCSNKVLGVRIIFPDCSNGKLDSLDHRSHMAYAQVPDNGGTARCPTSHPIPVPRLQTNVEFPIPPGTPGTPTLSTPSGTSGAYSTMHAGFFNAWDQARLEKLVNRCINAAPFTDSNPKPTVCL